MARNENEPYWLIRAVGEVTGCGTYPFTAGETNTDAIVGYWKEDQAEEMIALFDLHGIQLEAVLVTLRYVDGRPIVEEVFSGNALHSIRV